MGRGKARSSRDLPKPIIPKAAKVIGFGLWLMGFARAQPILLLAESITVRMFREEWLGPGGHPSQAAGRRIAPIPSLLGLT